MSPPNPPICPMEGFPSCKDFFVSFYHYSLFLGLLRPTSTVSFFFSCSGPVFGFVSVFPSSPATIFPRGMYQALASVLSKEAWVPFPTPPPSRRPAARVISFPLFPPDVYVFSFPFPSRFFFFFSRPSQSSCEAFRLAVRCCLH